MKWYVDDPDSLPQSSLSPFQDPLSTPSEMDYFPSLPPSNPLTFSQCQPSNSSQGLLSLISQDPLQNAPTQVSYLQSHGSQSVFNPSNGDSAGWFPTATHSQYISSRTNLKSRRAGSLSALNTVTKAATKAAKDDSAKSRAGTPQMSSQKKAVWWEEPRSITPEVKRSNTSECTDISNPVPSAIGRASQSHTQVSTSNTPPSNLVPNTSVCTGASGPEREGQRTEEEGQRTKGIKQRSEGRESAANNNKPSASMEVQPHQEGGGGAGSLLQWAGKGGSGPLWPSRGMDADPVTDIAASSPDITQTALASRLAVASNTRDGGKQLFYSRRRSFSGFMPASSYTISTSKVGSTPPPPQATPAVIPHFTIDHGPSEGSLAHATPSLDSKKTAGQSSMSPIPEASQEVPSSSQLADHHCVSSSHVDEHTSPFRHEGLMPSRNYATPSARELVGGASGGGPLVRQLSVGGAGSSLPGMEQGAYPCATGKSLSQVSRRQQTPSGVKPNSKAQRQRHMSWDLEVFNRAYSDMDLAEGQTPIGAMGMSPSTSERSATTSAATSVAVVTTTTPPLTTTTTAAATAHVRHASQQIPMERVLHGRLTQDDETHQAAVAATPAISVSSATRHVQAQANSATHNPRVSLSQQTSSALTSQSHSHSPVLHSRSSVPQSHSHSHSPPAEHVVSSTAVTSSSSGVSLSPHPTAVTTAQSARGPTLEDTPSFREPPPSYDEIFGVRTLSPRGGGHTLPPGQSLDPAPGRNRFASFVSFFKRMRRREATEPTTPLATPLQDTPTQIPPPPPARYQPASSSSSSTAPGHGIAAISQPWTTMPPLPSSSQSSLQPTWSTVTPRTTVTSRTSIQSTVHDGGRSGAVRSDSGRSGTVGSDGGRSGVVGSDGGRSGVVGSDGGRSGVVGSDGGRSGVVGSDGGRSGVMGSDSGRRGAVGSVNFVRPHMDLQQQDQEFVPDRRVNPPYRPPPPFNPVTTRDPARPGSRSHLRDQSRAPQHREQGQHDLLQGAPTPQLITGLDRRSLYLTSATSSSRDPVQLRATNRRGVKQRPQSEMIPNNYPPLLEFSHAEENEFTGSQVPPLFQSSGLSASCMNIETEPVQPAIAPSTQGRPNRTRRILNTNTSGPGSASLPSSSNPSIFKTSSNVLSTVASRNTSSSLSNAMHSAVSNASLAPINSISSTLLAPITSASSLPSASSNTPLMAAPSNTSLVPSNAAPSNTSLVPSNAAPSNTSLVPSNAASSNTSLVPSNAASSNTSLVPSNAAPSNTSLVPSNAAPSNTSLVPSNAAPSNTSLVPSNAAPSNTSLVPSNAACSNTSVVSHRSPTSSNPPSAPNSSFALIYSTSAVHTSSASSSSATLITTHSTTSLVNSASLSSHSSAGPTTALEAIHTTTASTTHLNAPIQPSSDLQNASLDASLHLVPTSTIHPISEPCSTVASERLQSEVPTTAGQQRSPRTVHITPSEQSHTVSDNSTAALCQPSTQETVRAGKCNVCVYNLCTYSMSPLETDITQGRKSCGHLCLKERRFCCLCQYNHHREISLDDICLLCTRYESYN